LFLKKNDKHTALYVVGDGSALKDAQKLAHQLDISDRVFFTGRLPEKQAQRHYSTSDILVLPTYFPEGFPLAIIWSLAHGIPIITTRIRGTADLLKEPKNCLWVPPRNARILAQKISYLHNHPSLRSTMSKNNLKLAKTFDAKLVSHDLIRAYKDTVR
jgi:glycosyltransferase involved in cell wall biosynthesis